MTVICTKWRKLESGSLKGFADLNLVEIGMTLRGVLFHVKGDKSWVTFPAMPRLVDGKQVTGDDGKGVFWPPVVDIREDRRDRFRAAAVEAILAFIEASGDERVG